jgi:iron(III) transport system substrate-binding protein
MNPLSSIASKRAKWLSVVALVTAFIVAPAFSVVAEPSAELIARAKKEGKLVVYVSAQVPAPDIPPMFEEKYGIETLAVKGTTAQLRERIRMEQATGRFVSDVHYSGLSTNILQLGDGMLQAHGGLQNARSLISPFTDISGTIIPVASGRYGILINTNLVKQQDEPKTWKDLLDPKWQGKIIMADPRMSGSGYLWFTALRDVYSDEYHKQFATQKAVFEPNSVQALTRVARGEFPVYAGFNFAQLYNTEAFPIKAIAPAEGSPTSPHSAAIVKGAKNLHAARLFMEFLLDKEVQGFYANRGWASVVGFVPSDLPKVFEPLANTKLFDLADPDQQDSMMEIAKGIYK